MNYNSFVASELQTNKNFLYFKNKSDYSILMTLEDPFVYATLEHPFVNVFHEELALAVAPLRHSGFEILADKTMPEREGLIKDICDLTRKIGEYLGPPKYADCGQCVRTISEFNTVADLINAACETGALPEEMKEWAQNISDRATRFEESLFSVSR